MGTLAKSLPVWLGEWPQMPTQGERRQGLCEKYLHVRKKQTHTPPPTPPENWSTPSKYERLRWFEIPQLMTDSAVESYISIRLTCTEDLGPTGWRPWPLSESTSSPWVCAHSWWAFTRVISTPARNTQQFPSRDLPTPMLWDSHGPWELGKSTAQVS